MAERIIRAGIVTYQDASGRGGAVGFQGETVDVHEDDLERFDRLNPEAPKVEDESGVDEQADEEREFPEGEPVEAWKGDELKAYAKAHGFEIGSASKKADIVAAIQAAAAAKAEGEQPPAGEGEQSPADGDSQE